jgi:2-dehydro-3-deoxy-L-rhamnonate dehydrogenase (NAD+)
LSNTYDLNGKFAIVTGGAQSIGRAVAELMLRSGAFVVIWDKDKAAVAGARSAVVDIARPEDIAAGLAELGPDQAIDILVNCAGALGTSTPFVSQSPTEWLQLVNVNLVGTLQVTQAVLPSMLRRRSGRIVNLGSLAGKEGLPGLAGYSAASAGVISFTKALSREVAKDNVLVNCVAPGPIDTDMIRKLGDDVVARMIQDSPLGRLGKAEEVAQLVVWLCSDASRFNTGAVFDMSGGRARY